MTDHDDTDQMISRYHKLLDTERQRQCDAHSAQPVEPPCTKKGAGKTPDQERLWIRYGDSPPVLAATMSSDRFWNMLTKEDNDPELKQGLA